MPARNNGVLSGAVGITITAITRPSGAQGPINISYLSTVGAGGNVSWNSPADLDLQLQTDPVAVASEWGVLMFYIAWWKARSADYSNTSLVLNKTGTMDLTAPSPWKVQ